MDIPEVNGKVDKIKTRQSRKKRGGKVVVIIQEERKTLMVNLYRCEVLFFFFFLSSIFSFASPPPCLSFLPCGLFDTSINRTKPVRRRKRERFPPVEQRREKNRLEQ